MPSILRLATILRRRPRTEEPDSGVDSDLDGPKFGEILAASTMPDFAALPLEFWPGYRRYFRTEWDRED